jgi:hypothetical protein
MDCEQQIDLEEVIRARLNNYDRLKSLGIKVSWVGNDYIVDGKKKDKIEDYQTELNIEEVISARIGNYETMREIGINAVWIGADYTTIDDKKKDEIMFNTIVVVEDKEWKSG